MVLFGFEKDIDYFVDQVGNGYFDKEVCFLVDNQDEVG